MTDFAAFSLMVLLLAAARLVAMVPRAVRIARSLGDKSAAAETLRNSLALACVLDCLSYFDDLQTLGRRLVN